MNLGKASLPPSARYLGILLVLLISYIDIQPKHTRFRIINIPTWFAGVAKYVESPVYISVQNMNEKINGGKRAINVVNE